MSKPDFGKPYGTPFRTQDGKIVQMWRKGQRVRFYAQNGVQVGPEQTNVAPATAYALDRGWESLVRYCQLSLMRTYLDIEMEKTTAPAKGKEKKMKNKEPSPILKYFEYKHLPEPLQIISASICDLAVEMEGVLPPCAEKSAGLRKLLEAKDCFVRAALEE